MRDSEGVVRTLKTGEGIGEFSGVSDQEVGKLEQTASGSIRPDSNYDDGSTSTYGYPNRWDDKIQALEFLREGREPVPVEVEGVTVINGLPFLDGPIGDCRGGTWHPPCS